MKLREKRQWMKEVANQPDDELREELAQLRDKLFTLRTQAVTEKVENNTQFRTTRRQIARVLTVLTAREQEVND